MRDAPLPVYPFGPETEREITVACATDPRFWATIGHAIDPRRIVSSNCRRVIMAVQNIAKLTGGGPTKVDRVIQRMRNVLDDGKMSIEEFQETQDYLLEALEAGYDTDLSSVIVGVVRKSHFKDAVATAQIMYGKDGSPEDVAAMLDKVSKIGNASTVGLAVSPFQVIERGTIFNKTSRDEKSTTGIPELDDAIDFGLERCALGLFVGASGAGKSMALAHVACESLLRGRDVFYPTLELGVDATTARILRNLVDMTQRELELPGGREILRYRLSKLVERGLGKIFVQYMEPGETSPRDIRVAIKDCIKANPGFNPQTLVVDFLDKVRCNQKASLYEDMLAVTDGLRSIAVELDGWTWTASQAKGSSTNKPWLAIDAAADSMNKIRSADIVIGIGRTEDDEVQNLVRFSVPKKREGEGAHTRIGPIPWDPEHGRICTVERPIVW